MMRILVVDDHLLFRQGIASLIDRWAGMTVVGDAGSVAEAVDEARRLKPDVVLMDFMLPDGTGLEATKAILAERPSTKIVFLTVHAEDERLLQAIRRGAKGYLLKNTSVTELVAYLRGVGRGEPALPPDAMARVMEAYAHAPVGDGPEADLLEQLTARQMEVLRELKEGATNKEIASKLVISEQTVKNHVGRILRTLNVRSRHEAGRIARQFDL